MAPTTKNLKDPLHAQNPRRVFKNSYPTHNAHTEAFLQTQPPSLPSSQALSRPHRSCQQALSRPRSPGTETRAQQSSSISLSHPRLIALPHSSSISLSANQRFHHATRSFAGNSLLATIMGVGGLLMGHRRPNTPRCPRNRAKTPPRHNN